MNVDGWPFGDLTVEQVVALIEQTDDPRDLDAIIAGIEAELEWTPWPHQIAPTGDWTVWLLLAGRGSGKTDGCANDMNAHATSRPCDDRLPGGHRMSIVAPTLGDAAESCVNGPSGLKAHNPDVRMVSTIGGTIVRWPNGAEAKLFGGSSPQDVERFRAGGNRCRAWVEEAAAIPHLDAILAQIPFGHRLGRNPQVVMSTTPKPRAALRRLQEQARTFRALDGVGTVKRWERVIITHATTDDNPALDQEVRAGLYDLYHGTRLAQQELLGMLVEDFDGALWSRGRIDELRVVGTDDLPALQQSVCGIDPSAWGVKALETGTLPPAGEVGRGVETGIVVSGMSSRREVFTVADLSGRMTPNDWANRAIDGYVRWRCTRMAPETNFGGPLTIANIKAAEAARRAAGETLPAIRVLGVRATDGKRVRAEPVAGLTEQGRHHLFGYLPLLEDQMVQWDPNENWSPDRLDAMVHSVTSLQPWRVAHAGVGGAEPRGAVRRS